MKCCVIYYSYSGITKGIALKIRDACGAELVEVSPKEKYTSITAYTFGCIRARNEQSDQVMPETIDLSPYDLIVIGGPVWAWKPAPPANGAIQSLKGGNGKKAVIFVTCGSKAGESVEIMKKAIELKGLSVIRKFSFTRKEVSSDSKIHELLDFINKTMSQG